MKRTAIRTAATREIGLGIACVLLLIVVELTPVRTMLQAAIVPIAVPIQQLTIRMAQVVSVVWSPATRWLEAQQKIEELSQQLALSQGQVIELEQLKAENAQLRELLENRHISVAPRRLARPIVSSAAPLVWLGEAASVQPGWLVLYKNIVLGKVTSVDGQYARVGLLTTSADSNLLVQTSQGVRGIATGTNGRVVVTNIAPEAIITIGERVTTVGQPGIAPGKFIGIVAAVERDPASAAQQLVIDQLVSFYQTSVVEIEE